MKTFAVYRKDEDVHLVKRGWSWPGFLLGFWWALYRGLWTLVWISVGYGAVLVGILIWIELVDNTSFSLVLYPSWLLLALWVGRVGNGFREKKLGKQGYELSRVVEGESEEQALEAYIEGLRSP